MPRWIEATAATASPGLVVSAHALGAIPLPLAVIGAVAGPLVYMYRLTMVGVLGWKALDKTNKDNRVAEVMSTITGQPLGPPDDEVN